ncbi:glycoside hydrolase family 99-like domain-containing protein [Methanospirillum stamsii]|uniref:Glycoside hydrolase family 5 domain-containing protein n=1 Tax=Methanospirillum stamsii TaxID=1277351 RepID=A0A2V2N584_9EURY|nr:glycoside hydrolase family 99-like domain-containing protein [Methanospirillum stamsii]PWR72916.1 hypothetical protein DLD82_11650 [Methanospirillum stamsii]
MIGAHYYPWYGKLANIIIGGGNWDSGTAHTPILGKYSSDNEEVIREHVRMAKSAGIDFFILEWTGPGLWEDKIIRKHCIPVFESMQMPFCIMYDSYFTLHKTETDPTWDLSKKYDCRITKGMKMIEDFQYLLRTYFSHPLYFHIQKRPAVMVFLAYKYRDTQGLIKKLRTLEGMPEGGPFLIGDIISTYFSSKGHYNVSDILSYLYNTSLSGIIKKINLKIYSGNHEEKSVLSELDAISGYNIIKTNGEILENYKKSLQYLKKTSEMYHNVCIPFIFPGYDDTNLRGSRRERHTIKRGNNGEFYRNIIKIAQKFVNPNINLLILTSFNEWHEGTEIEPSKQYGDLFLNITSDLT